MTRADNPYAALGVDPNASQEEISSAFRRAMRSSHPDHNGDAPADHSAITNLVAAWHIMGDPARRADFDRADHTSDHAIGPTTHQSIKHTAGIRPALLVRLFIATVIATATFLTILFTIAMSQSG